MDWRKGFEAMRAALHEARNMAHASARAGVLAGAAMAELPTLMRFAELLAEELRKYREFSAVNESLEVQARVNAGSDLAVNDLWQQAKREAGDA